MYGLNVFGWYFEIPLLVSASTVHRNFPVTFEFFFSIVTILCAMLRHLYLSMLTFFCRCVRQWDGLVFWCLSRQGQGFNGRPNKVEDSCYTFWIGASLKVTGRGVRQFRRARDVVFGSSEVQSNLSVERNYNSIGCFHPPGCTAVDSIRL